MDAVNKKYLAAVIISSDRAHQGTYEDKSGPAIKNWIEKNELLSLEKLSVLPDDAEILKSTVTNDTVSHDVVIVCGGTGLGPRDISPQAIKSIADYNIPGIGEMLRTESLKYSLNSYLSRCGGWVKNQKLILALPGNPKAVCEQLDMLKDLLPHILQSLKGECKHRRRTKSND